MRVAETILYLLFNLLRRHHRIQRRFRIKTGPNPMSPVNFFNSSLISHALRKRELCVRNLGWNFGTEERQQWPGQNQDHVKPASKKIRFTRGANVCFHFACAQVEQTTFTRSTSKMSKLSLPTHI